MNYMRAYISNWIVPFPKRDWYPQKRTATKTRVMQDAYLEGYSVKSIAEYFNITQFQVYQVLNVKSLKVKMKEKELLNKLNKS